MTRGTCQGRGRPAREAGLHRPVSGPTGPARPATSRFRFRTARSRRRQAGRALPALPHEGRAPGPDGAIGLYWPLIRVEEKMQKERKEPSEFDSARSRGVPGHAHRAQRVVPSAPRRTAPGERRGAASMPSWPSLQLSTTPVHLILSHMSVPPVNPNSVSSLHCSSRVRPPTLRHRVGASWWRLGSIPVHDLLLPAADSDERDLHVYPDISFATGPVPGILRAGQ